MEQLVSMKQRIKTIEVIRKITNAMRLISMSMHSKLRNRRSNLENYKVTFYQLWSRTSHLLGEDIKDINLKPKKGNLIILVASQKGLSGVFNSELFKFFNKYKITSDDRFITVSKYADDYLRSKDIPILESYKQLTSNTFVHISQSITNTILKNLDQFNSIRVFSNHPKTFFIQEPKENIVFPFSQQTNQNNNQQENVDYIFDQPVQELSETIKQLIISINIQDLIFESLLAEQAARFLSMDSATRNAENLLSNMKIEYNKLRQANITRELTELSSSFNQL